MFAHATDLAGVPVTHDILFHKRIALCHRPVQFSAETVYLMLQCCVIDGLKRWALPLLQNRRTLILAGEFASDPDVRGPERRRVHFARPFDRILVGSTVASLWCR